VLPTNFYFWLDNKNVDIKFNAHDASLEQPPPGMLKIERLESQIKVLRAIKPKGLNRIAKPLPNRIAKPLPTNIFSSSNC
jgi:hypothetical protein